jgi:hypothetical protein
MKENRFFVKKTDTAQPYAFADKPRNMGGEM